MMCDVFMSHLNGRCDKHNEILETHIYEIVMPHTLMRWNRYVFEFAVQSNPFMEQKIDFKQIVVNFGIPNIDIQACSH